MAVVEKSAILSGTLSGTMSAREEWEQEAWCSVCLDLFDNPVILVECGHNLCYKCAKQLHQHSGGNSIECPECKKLTTVPKGGISEMKRNITLHNLVKKLKAEKTRREVTTSAGCGNCGKSPVLYECLECRFGLCAECKETQHAQEGYKLHTVGAVGQVMRYPLCPVDKREMDLYCTDSGCQCLVCYYCVQFGCHRNHNDKVIRVVDHAEATKAELRASMVTLRERADSLQQTVKAVDLQMVTVEKDYRLIRDQIRGYFERLFQALIEREEQCLKQVEEGISYPLKKLCVQRDAATAAMEQANAMYASCNRLLLSSAGDLLGNRKKIMDRMAIILDNCVPTPEETLGCVFEPPAALEESVRMLCVQRKNVLPRVYLDLALAGGVTLGRVVIELYADVLPKAAENFRLLCVGEKGSVGLYQGSKFHTLTEGALWGGCSNHCSPFGPLPGEVGISAFGGTFEPEDSLPRGVTGDVVMVLGTSSADPNSSSSGGAAVVGVGSVFGIVLDWAAVPGRLKDKDSRSQSSQIDTTASLPPPLPARKHSLTSTTPAVLPETYVVFGAVVSGLTLLVNNVHRIVKGGTLAITHCGELTM